MKVLNPNKPEPEEVKVVAEKPPSRVEKRALAKATRNVKNGIMTTMRKLVRVQQEAVLPTIQLTIIRADVQANKRKREREEAESSNATSSKRVNIDPIHRSIVANATTQDNCQQLQLELLRMKFQQLDRTLPLSNAERHSKCRQLTTLAKQIATHTALAKSAQKRNQRLANTEAHRGARATQSADVRSTILADNHPR